MKWFIEGFIRFKKGVLGMALGWRLWMGVVIAANLIVPLFYLGRIEAQVVLAGLMAGAALMSMLTAWKGFTRIVGLGHILWVPMIVFLWTRLGAHPAADFYGAWLRAVIALDAAAFAIDLFAAGRYLAGAREETVAGL